MKKLYEKIFLKPLTLICLISLLSSMAGYAQAQDLTGENIEFELEAIEAPVPFNSSASLSGDEMQKFFELEALVSQDQAQSQFDAESFRQSTQDIPLSDDIKPAKKIDYKQDSDD